MTNNEKPVSEEFPHLFHYTAVSAFENIYHEKKLRATYYGDMNDKSELGRFRRKVIKFIKPIIREIFYKKMKCDTQFAMIVKSAGGLEAFTKKQAVEHLDMLHKYTFGIYGCEPFVCSFCAHSVKTSKKKTYEEMHGLLSQWRGYGEHGGVAIVLKTCDIEGRMRYEQNTFEHTISHMGEVIYDDDDTTIEKYFCKVFECFPEILNRYYSGETPNYEGIYEHFVQGSTRVKHHGFHEENEIRIVVAPRPANKDSVFYEPKHDKKPSKVVHYAKKDNREARYINLFGGNDPLPIERVIVGPSRFQNFNYQTVRDLVKGSKIKVDKSETPFIG